MQLPHQKEKKTSSTIQLDAVRKLNTCEQPLSKAYVAEVNPCDSLHAQGSLCENGESHFSAFRIANVFLITLYIQI